MTGLLIKSLFCANQVPSLSAGAVHWNVSSKDLLPSECISLEYVTIVFAGKTWVWATTATSEERILEVGQRGWQPGTY